MSGASREKLDVRTLRILVKRLERGREEAVQERARWGGVLDVHNELIAILMAQIQLEESPEAVPPPETTQKQFDEFAYLGKKKR